MKTVTTLVALGIILTTSFATAQQPSQPQPAEISTSAEGEVRLPPTRALVRFGIEARAANAAQASSQASAKVKAVREAIRAQGFPLDSIRTVSFMVTPRYDWQRAQKLVDYAANASIELNVRNLEKVAGVMDAALAAGVTQMPDVSFDSDSVQAARATAISRAMASAKADAEATARAAGGRLGKLLSASTSGGGYPRPRGMVEMQMAKAADGAPQVDRDVIVQVSVQTRWEFLAGQ